MLVPSTIRTRAALAAAAALLLVPTPRQAQQTPRPPQTENSARSSIDARVLLVAAHPDDEDTQLITWLVRGRGVETAYLSLTRGDGGQNLIGNELGEALGVIRTQELLAARRIDGARQFFTRAYDFGFSKSAEEAFSHWPKQELLGDVVKVVRAFRPHIIIALFQERGGHGQHQVSAILAREAYDAAFDTARFPVGEFGQAWTPLKFYRTARFAPALATLRINVGEFNPALGASYAEIAAESRSQHKSQGFGMLRRLGIVWDYITLEHARTAPPAVPGVESSIFEGLNISPRGGSPDSARSQEIRRTVAFQAIADRQTAAAGESVRVTKTVYNRGEAPVVLMTRPPLDSASKTILPDSSYQWVESMVVGDITQPWWLAVPRTGDLFTPAIRAASEDARAKANWATVEVGSNPRSRPVILSTPIVFHYVDPVRGDVQRPLVVAPGISVAFDRTIEIARSSAPLERFINVTLRSAFSDTIFASVALELPATLTVDSARRAATLAPGATRTFTFRISGRLPRGTHEIRAIGAARGKEFRSGYVPVEYEHIDPDRIYRPSTLTVRAIEVALPPRLDVAYVQGVGDNVAPMLEQLGVPVTPLNPADIPATDLSRFSTIVVGPRAYEASDALTNNNNHLLTYVRNGGRLVVQYGQYEMMRPGVMPYPITIRRPHDRVTEENAVVSIVDRSSALLTSPNRITADDFSGWTQERALYMPFTFDARYSAPLSMTDPGEDPKRGALLFARYGRGTYVYVPLALFRQLPAGVPGGARIFANLLAGAPR